MADGDNLRLGRANTSSASTRVTRSGSADVSAFTVSNNGSGTGVFGISNANAVFGRSTSPNDSGVYGENTGGGYGTAGRTAGPQPAVWGDNTGTGDGVFGTTASPNDSGVYGHNHGGGWGVTGRTHGPTPAIWGDNTGTGDGVVGQSPSGYGIVGKTASEIGMASGVYGSGNRFGVRGEGLIAVFGQGTRERGVGVSAQAVIEGGHGLSAYGQLVGMRAGSDNWAGIFEGLVTVRGDLLVTGSKSAEVVHPDGSHRLLYALESPESWFEDFGRAQMSRGRARVELDGDFAALVRTDDYHVFLTPEGDSNGLYVSGRSEDGFEVREQRGGTSELAFSYRVVAKRKDIEAERLQRAEAPPPPPPTPPEYPGDAAPPLSG